MRNKKGFIFIETIITIVVLAVSLLYVYSSFNSILIKEKTRVHYDDVSYIYRTYYVKNFFAKFELNDVLKTLTPDNPMVIIGCDYSGIFGDRTGYQSVCNDLYNNLGIENVAVALNYLKISSEEEHDLSYIQDCNPDDASASSRCSYLKNFSAEEQVYLGSLGALDTKNKYIMIIEYKEAETTERFVRNYAWVRI